MSEETKMREENQKTGMVYLVGAGPGEEGLMTMRGRELLSQAEVVVYDRLANASLLRYVPETCKKICVGKRVGAHTWKQEEIQMLLVEEASKGRMVVRLKGGDPFVFGRGGEEVLALSAAGIPYEVVSGVTSAVAALAAAGIPATHRGLAESFHVITGHTQKDMLPAQLAQYAKLDGTLIFLMGIGHLREIADGLLAGGKSPDCPASIVEQGTTIRQRRTDAVLGDIAMRAKEANVRAPGILVVGGVASLHMRCEALPLSGKRVAVTGTGQLVEKQCALLRARGAQVLPVPYMHTKRLKPTEKEKNDILQAAWLVFTSANGVRAFFDWMREARIDRRAVSHARYAVIGKGTQETLQSYGIFADYMPDVYTVEALARGLLDSLQSEAQAADSAHICVLRAKEGSSRLQEIWEAGAVPYRDIAIYETTANQEALTPLYDALPELDYVTFSSASAVRAFFASPAAKKCRMEMKFACIGMQTAAALQSCIKEPERILTAQHATSEALVDCL